jgi:hypothetical protein
LHRIVVQHALDEPGMGAGRLVRQFQGSQPVVRIPLRDLGQLRDAQDLAVVRGGLDVLRQQRFGRPSRLVAGVRHQHHEQAMHEAAFGAQRLQPVP